MKRFLRLCSLLLTFSLVLSLAAGAADTDGKDYSESAPDFTHPTAPEWNEISLSIPAGGGSLDATLTVPDTADLDNQVPMVLLMHGLNSTQNWCSDLAWYLADQGIASIRFNFSGYCRDDSSEATMTVMTQVADILSVLDFAEDLEFVDTGHIYLLGKSMGGVSSLLAASERMDEIAGVCLWYPGLGITDAVQHGYLLGTTFDAADVPATVTCDNYTYCGDFIRQCQALDLDSVYPEITCPVLIVHGDRDLVAPVIYSKDAAKLLPDCRLEIIPGGTHGFSGQKELDALQLTGQWFARQLQE